MEADTICARMSSSLESTPIMGLCNDTKRILLNGYTGMLPSTDPFPLGPGFRFKLNAESHRLPDNVSFAEGALLEPLSVVMNGIRSAGLSLGRGVVVCGAGPIGLIALAAARASGAHPVVITDIDPGRLAFARKFVPSCMTYQVNPQLDAEGNGRAIKALFGSEEYFAPETVLECTGVESSICTATFTARRGGTVMVIGVGKPTINNIPFMHISLAEVRGLLPFQSNSSKCSILTLSP